jgi:phosphoenolpyruvate-protein phosphotransferase/dihydroxyacetone kinase phosphotransfer subunit
MVSLVLVSHSLQLVEALERLLRQVTPGELEVAIAAGTGVDHQEFGTDPLEIANAIQSVYSEDGVVVLMDLGSAVLSSEMAVEFLAEKQRPYVRCCPGALVEGAIAAAALAGAGANLDQVLSEAQRALDPKIEHLEAGQGGVARGVWDTTTVPSGDLHSISLTLQNEHGLHARPAGRFVKAAAAYKADIQVTNLRSGKGPASARSLNALATLGAVSGDRILVTASGPEAELALTALSQLVEDQFNLPPVPVNDITSRLPKKDIQVQSAGSSIHGVPLAVGIALGPLVFYKPELPEIRRAYEGEPEQEWHSLQEAIGRTRALIERRRMETLARAGELQAEIFTAHLLILEDPELLNEVKERIFTHGKPAVLAWQESINQSIEAYKSLEDPYLRARSLDVSDVGEQVILAKEGNSGAISIQLDESGILYLDSITPTQIVQLDQTKVQGLVIYSSGATSHSAILARALGFPAVSGVNLEAMGIQPGTLAALDGSTGDIWLDPDQQTENEFLSRREIWLEHRRDLLKGCREPAITRDGRQIEIAANVGSVAEARAALKNGAEGIGVLRTEFLYLSRDEPPDEAEQLAVLLQIAQILDDQKVIVRTLDIGGDKYLPYIQVHQEANPYLGVRGLRLSMRMPELFQSQLRAILQAGADRPVSIMFPMVSSYEEVVWAKDQLLAAHQALGRDGLAHRWPVETGIMVEVPSAALTAQALAPLVDFFSIGTNDLTQYTLAAERGNPELANLGDALHPAILHLIEQVVASAHAQGKWVGVCGEIAADPLAVPVLVGLGVDELSMNLAEIPLIKSVIRQLDLPETEKIAAQALTCSEAFEVRDLVKISQNLSSG